MYVKKGMFGEGNAKDEMGIRWKVLEVLDSGEV
jgi:hypothetical protein